MVIDLFSGGLKAVCIVMLLDILRICYRTNRNSLILALSKRFHDLEALTVNKRDNKILLVEPSEVIIECDEMLLHVALIVNQIGIQLFHELGFIHKEVQLAQRDKRIGALAEVELCPEKLIHNDDVVMPDVTFLLEDLDLLAGNAVLAHHNAMLQKTERLQQGITCRVGQREAPLVDIGAHFHIIAGEQIVKDIFMLDGNRLLEDVLVERLHQEFIAMEIYKYYSHFKKIS